ncbi:MAG: hypothetical protein JST86_17485 [Bacteroidetes bacterium]|nr:hypothetical protein [Bacteroidota bacterium]
MKWLKFILSHSIFIAICAAALCYQTAVLLQVTLTPWLYAFIFFSTITSYNFYWLLSGFVFSRQSIYDFLRKFFSNVIALLAGGAGMLITLPQLVHLWGVIAIGSVLTILYTIPLLPVKILQTARRYGLIKTFLLAFTWAFVTVLIPYQQQPTGNTITLFMLFNNRFLFMLMLCIIFDARDTKVDQIRGLQSLTTIISAKTVQYIMYGIFAAFLLNGIALRMYYHEQLQIIALLITGVVTAMVYFFSLKKQGYYFYYFVVDGMMLFSALATYVASI